MRDAEVYRLLGERMTVLSDMVVKDVTQLQRGISLLRCRQDAIERLLFGSRWAILRIVVLQLISPSILRKTLNVAHTAEIERYNKNRRKAQESSKIKAAPQAGLIQL